MPKQCHVPWAPKRQAPLGDWSQAPTKVGCRKAQVWTPCVSQGEATLPLGYLWDADILLALVLLCSHPLHLRKARLHQEAGICCQTAGLLWAVVSSLLLMEMIEIIISVHFRDGGG